MFDFVVPTLCVLAAVGAYFWILGLLGNTNHISTALLRPFGGRAGVRTLLSGVPAAALAAAICTRKVAVTADEVALFLHEVELGADVGLSVTTERKVYVTRRQLRRIRQHLRATFTPEAEPELVFREYGWELVLTRAR